MDKILAKIDALIDKIPIHIRDLIQKGFISLVALVALVAIVTGIKKGIDNATPGGVQLFEKNKDIFYIQRLREENAKNNKLIEDIEVYEDLFESRDERLHPTFQKLGRNTDDRIIGEREEFIRQDPLRKKDTNLLIEEDEKFTEEYPAPDDLRKKEPRDDIPFIENPDPLQRVKNMDKNDEKAFDEKPRKSQIKEDTGDLKLLE